MNALSIISDLNTRIVLYAYTMGLKMNSPLFYDIGIQLVNTVKELLERTTIFINVEECEVYKIQHWGGL